MTVQTQDTTLTTPSGRSPLEHPSGIFIVDKPAFGGAACFLWFEDDAEALAHLRLNLASFYGEESDSEDTKADRSLSWEIGVALAGAERLADVDLDRLNKVLEGLCEIRWTGTVDDLRRGDRPFERGLQEDYHANVFGAERGQSGSDWDDFVHHLTYYQD